MSFSLGNKGEEIWLNHIKSSHQEIELAPKRKFYDWDIKGTFNGDVLTYEVKYDNSGYYYARRHRKDVNLYIEFRNTNKGENSGILASKAIYYVYMLCNHERDEVEIYVFNRLELLTHLQNNNYPVKGNKTGGDNNASGWLPPLKALKNLVLKKIIKKK